MNIQTTPFSSRWEIEYMVEQLKDDTDKSKDEIHRRLQAAKQSEQNSASELAHDIGSGQIEWLEGLGHDFDQLSREARKKRFEAKDDWRN